mmetsp:Transcript_6853/g.21349  ORF Transcript_6853/g.21349 Transcript_6853/m.21349 type:complete len:247 (+) Transcript_6853:1787-2527(+)
MTPQLTIFFDFASCLLALGKKSLKNSLKYIEWPVAMIASHSFGTALGLVAQCANLKQSVAPRLPIPLFPAFDSTSNFTVSSTIVFNVPLSFATFVIPVYGTASNASPANANASTFLAISCKASFTNNFSFVRSNLSINAIAAVCAARLKFDVTMIDFLLNFSPFAASALNTSTCFDRSAATSASVKNGSFTLFKNFLNSSTCSKPRSLKGASTKNEFRALNKHINSMTKPLAKRKGKLTPKPLLKT